MRVLLREVVILVLLFFVILLMYIAGYEAGEEDTIQWYEDEDTEVCDPCDVEAT